MLPRSRAAQAAALFFIAALAAASCLRSLETFESPSPLNNNLEPLTTTTTTQCEFWMVLVGDANETIASLLHVNGSLAPHWCAVLVATRNAPGDAWRALAQGSDVLFHLSRSDQLALPFASALHSNGVEKNLGYLYALQRGAKAVFDFDASENHRLETDGQDLANWALRLSRGADYFPNATVRARMARMHLWCARHAVVNPLPDLGPRHWTSMTPVFAVPDALPAELADNANTFLECDAPGEVHIDRAGIVHFPAMRRASLYFAPRPKHFGGVALPPGTLSFFDARSTLYFPRAFFALALVPPGVNALAPDAMRALYASRLLWDTSALVVHAHPISTTDGPRTQRASPLRLVNAMADWTPPNASAPLPERAAALARALVDLKLLSPKQELALRAWWSDLAALGLTFGDPKDVGGGAARKVAGSAVVPEFAVERDRLLNASFAASLLLRLFSADKKSHMYWYPTAELFVNRDELDTVVVFDAESPDDHRFAARLFQRHGVRCTFEPLPFNHTGVFNAKRAVLGYQRQIYSTMYSDNHSYSDAIGLVDGDTIAFGLITVKSIFGACGSRRKINLYAQFDHPYWPADGRMLALPQHWLGFMEQAVFPYWLWRSTFARARARVSAVHANATLEAVWPTYTAQYGAGVPYVPYSNFGILGNYAATFELDKYCVTLSTLRVRELEVANNVGSSRLRKAARIELPRYRAHGSLCEDAACYVARAGHHSGGSLWPTSSFVRVGCAVTFGVRCLWTSNATITRREDLDLLAGKAKDTMALQCYASGVLTRTDPKLPASAVRNITAAYWLDAQQEVREMSARSREEMQQACEQFCASSTTF